MRQPLTLLSAFGNNEIEDRPKQETILDSETGAIVGGIHNILTRGIFESDALPRIKLVLDM
jgi:hypothetical protein